MSRWPWTRWTWTSWRRRPRPRPPRRRPKARGRIQPAQPAPAPAADDNINLSALVGPSVNGTLKIGKLVVRGLKADDVAATAKLDKGKLDVSSLTAGLYGGKLAGTLSLDAAQGNQIATKLSLAGIAIEPLLMDLAQKNVLSGTGSLALDLKTAGANAYAMKSGLGGTLQLRLRDGAVKGINLTQTLRELKAVISPDAQDHTVAADSSKQTEFSEMDADLAFTKGVAAVKRLNFVSPLLRVTQGEPASIDFVRNELDLARARVVNPSASEEGKELIDLKDVTIPVHVRGTFDKPSYTVLWKEAIGGILKRSLENKLRDAVTGSGARRRGRGQGAQGPAGTMSDAPQHQPVAECGLTAQPEAAPYHRQWLVANDSGQWLNRELCPRLAEVSVELRMGYLVLKAPGMLRMDIPLDVIETTTACATACGSASRSSTWWTRASWPRPGSRTSCRCPAAS